MAIWQFRFSLLPKKTLIEKHGLLPDYLDEYKENFDNESHCVDISYENYWEGFNLEALSNQYEKLLPTVESSWSDDTKVLGNTNGSKIELSKDEVYIKFDARKPDYTFLREVVTTAKHSDCVCVIEESGCLLLPDFELILQFLYKSRAYRFCENPDELLGELSRKKEKYKGRR